MFNIPWSGPDDVSLHVVGVSLFVCKSADPNLKKPIIEVS